MQLSTTGQELSGLMEQNLGRETFNWISEKLDVILTNRSAKDLYLTYTLLGARIDSRQMLEFPPSKSPADNYLQTHSATLLELARIYLLIRVLEENKEFFTPKVAQLIQVADTGELKTFLRYLVLLPNAADFCQVAVEALRTNIAIVFDAIALENPYPAQFFNNQQWNQMYLKAAFMQRNLDSILNVDERANKDLARIISDYAHERWAASRQVDPLFWRPVCQFLEGGLLDDMKRLLQSENPIENMAGALCCFNSEQEKAHELLADFPEWQEKVEHGHIQWNDLKN